MYNVRHSGKRHRHTNDASERKRMVSSGSRVLSISNQELNSNNNNNNNSNEEVDDADDALLVLSKEDFEKTIKLVTNNKITNSNTWDLRLIEYFYDMNHLKSDDGVSINFQTASATLDGCTKVISKRVDSVAVDTDALIQILAIDNNNSNKTKKKAKIHSNDSDDDDPDNDDSNDKDYIDENNQKKKKNRDKTNIDDNSGDQFLVSWSKLKPTDSQSQFVTIDPVFRKMISDFDEGGAKSLLLNNLKITFDGKILFNDEDNNNNNKEISFNNPEDYLKNASLIKKDLDKDDDIEYDNKIFDSKINHANKTDDLETNELLSSFKFIIDNSEFELTICNEIKDVKNSVEDIEYGKKFIDKMTELNQKDEPKMELPDFNVEYDYDIDNFDLNDNIENNNTFNLSEITELDKTNSTNHAHADPNEENKLEDESMLDYDEIVKKESLLFAELDKRSNIQRIRHQHWKIRAINSNSSIISRPNSRDAIFKNHEENELSDGEINNKSLLNVNKKNHRNSNSKNALKKKEYVIDFMSDSASTDTSTLFQKSKKALRSINPNTINSELTTKPDLKVWNSERLVSSFLKPKRRFRNVFSGRSKSSKPVIIADRDFWASKYNDKNVMPNDDIDEDVADFLYDVMDKPAIEEAALNVTQSINHSNDDFVADDFDAGDYDFDAPIIDQNNNEVNLIKAPKSAWHRDSIHYEKRSKKINVRLLKQNLWDVTKHQVEVIEDEETPQERSDHKPIDLKLSNIVKDTYAKYEGREKSDLSTSFFFICMLHIANEEGLTIEKTDDLTDVIIHAKS